MDMCNKLTFIFVVCLLKYFTIAIEINNYEKLRLCVVQTKSNAKQMKNVCKNFSNKDPVECLFTNDRLSCMRHLTDSTVDFAVFEPEDLVVYSNAYSTSHILITHELRLLPNERASFEMIALVSKDIYSLSDLKGKKFCHPGFYSQSTEWTRVFANFFQFWIIPKKCEVELTLIENELSSLSEYFTSACIPGLWIPDVDEDNKLKRNYLKLHELCDSPNSYSTDDIYYGREGAIRCLVDGVGEIAWVRLADVQQYFKTFNMKNNSYNYLCPDGLARPLDSNYPCVWISRPWPVIAAHKNNAEKISRLLEETDNKSLSWYKYLMEALELYHVTPIALDTLKYPDDYLNEFNGFSSGNMRATCRPSRDVKWCIASNIEQQKCQWMSDVAIAYGIEPALSCLQLNKPDNCIEAIKNQQADLFIAKSEDITLGYEKNLTSLYHGMSKKIQDLNIFGILVKNNSNLWNLNDLRDKRACFPTHRGIEWNAFVDIIKKQNKLQRINSMWNCSDDKALNNYFKEIIINDNKIDENNSIERTYDCLISDKGDVAFVNLHYSNQTNFYKVKYNLRNLCVNEMEEKKFIECILTWTPLATVMVNVNMKELRRREIKTMLSLLDETFGFKLHNTDPLSFLLYGSFDNKDNIIFPMRTYYWKSNVNSTSQLPRSYINILNELQNPKSKLLICNSALNFYIKIDTALFSILIIIIGNFIINN